MPVSNTTVESVSQRVIQTRDGRSSTVYEILAGGVKYATFKQQIANEANRLIGMMVELTSHAEQKGEYTNHYIDDIRQATGAVQRDSFAPIQQAQEAQQRTQPVQQPQQPPIPRTGDEEPTQRDFRIARQTAAKVSAQLSGDNPKDFWANLEPLVTYFTYGFLPPEYDPAQQAPKQTAQRAEPTPYVPNGFEAPNTGGSEFGDDDIPFAQTSGPHGF